MGFEGVTVGVGVSVGVGLGAGVAVGVGSAGNGIGVPPFLKEGMTLTGVVLVGSIGYSSCARSLAWSALTYHTSFPSGVLPFKTG